MMCDLQHKVIEIERAGNGIVDSAAYPGRIPKFVEHLVVATVAELGEGGIDVEDLAKELNAATGLPGVLATHVGRCQPMLGGDHTFLMHIRAVDTASCDAAYSAASEVYGKHLKALKIDDDRADDHLGDVIIVYFYSEVIGAWDVKWPAIRIAIFQYKSEIAEEQREGLIQALSLLPKLFPSIKQVSWGKNIANESTCRKQNGYADADLGVILGFSSCQDMYDLGNDPKYWELLNFHGTSRLEHYDVLTLCIP